jgi:hypothetical protein
LATTDTNTELSQQASKIVSGSYVTELKESAKGIVNGGLLFGGVGIVYAMLFKKNTLIFGIGGFVAGLIMTTVFNKITIIKK